MKAKIYIYGQLGRIPFHALVLMGALIIPASGIIAQQRNAHSIITTSPGNNNSGTRLNHRTEVKTLSVIPGVTPRENAWGSDRNQGNIIHSNSAAKLSDFTGTSVNGEYQLTWQTVLENDVERYIVEYSVNNVDFQAAGSVIASNQPAYTFKHTIDANPVMYYRLKVISNNRPVSYSSPITVTSSLARPADLVTPTIIRDNVLNITLANSYKDVRLINNAGVEVFREYLGGRTGNRIGLNLPTLPAGPYYVRLIGNNNSITQRVIIM